MWLGKVLPPQALSDWKIFGNHLDWKIIGNHLDEDSPIDQ